jgi:hypothetical protein
MRNRSVNIYGVVCIFRKKLFGASVKGTLTAACTTPPGIDQILDISYEMIYYGIYACRAGFISVRARLGFDIMR